MMVVTRIVLVVASAPTPLVAGCSSDGPHKAAKLINMHSTDLLCILGFFPCFNTKAWHPSSRMWDKSGFCPLYISRGVVLLLDRVSVLFLTWTDISAHSPHMFSGRSRCEWITHAQSITVWCAHSARPFCADMYGAVSWYSMPCFCRYRSNSADVYSPPTSVWRRPTF